MIRFDCYRVDLAGGQIYKRGARLRLPDQSFRVLASLLERPGQAVTREDLRRRLWPDEVFVDYDNGLNSAVARLREALGDGADHPRYIETLPRHGYRFLAPVSDAEETERPGARRARLLVLPFLNLSGEASQDHVCDAVTDDLITELAAVAPDALGVIARTTAMRYKHSHKDVARIGAELLLDYVVEGGIRGSGDSMTINVQLVRVRDQVHVWARRYDAEPTDPFNVAASAAREVASVLDAGTRPARGAAGGVYAATRSTRDLVAYNEYLQGLSCFDTNFGTRYGAERAREHLGRALARDPNFVLAHDALAQSYWLDGYMGFMPPTDAFDRGRLHAIRAFELDDARAETHALLAQYQTPFYQDWPAVERELSRALELDPNSAFVRRMYAYSLLMPYGRVEEAAAEIEHSLEWDPLSIMALGWLGVMLVLGRHWDRAIEQGRVLTELDPISPWGHWLVGIGCRGKGLADEAIAAQRKAVEVSDGSAMMLGWFGLVLGAAGRRDEGRAVLERLELMARSTYVPPTSLAWACLGLRDVDGFFEWLNRAIDAHDLLMMPIKSYAFLDPVRPDPRYAALLRRMNLDK